MQLATRRHTQMCVSQSFHNDMFTCIFTFPNNLINVYSNSCLEWNLMGASFAKELFPSRQRFDNTYSFDKDSIRFCTFLDASILSSNTQFGDECNGIGPRVRGLESKVWKIGSGIGERSRTYLTTNAPMRFHLGFSFPWLQGSRTPCSTFKKGRALLL